jgi:hypothetical protein
MVVTGTSTITTLKIRHKPQKGLSRHLTQQSNLTEETPQSSGSMLDNTNVPKLVTHRMGIVSFVVVDSLLYT